MAPRVHTFTAGGSLASTSSGIDDDEGAPPPDPRVRVTKVNAGGDIESSSSPDGPAEIEAKRAAAAAKLASVPSALGEDTPELRRFCLDLAARSGFSSPSAIIAAAKDFRDFVLKGG